MILPHANYPDHHSEQLRDFLRQMSHSHFFKHIKLKPDKNTFCSLLPYQDLPQDMHLLSAIFLKVKKLFGASYLCSFIEVMNVYGAIVFTTPWQKYMQIHQPTNAQLAYKVPKGKVDTFVTTVSLKCCIIITTRRDGNFVLPSYSSVGGKCAGPSLEQV